MNLFFLYLFFVGVLGLCAGSFLNCVIYRLEKREGLTGRSYCPKCKKQLKWQDLFPVFSFLFLLGKCRYCGKKISWQYPTVEFVTAVLFVLVFLNLGFDWALGIGIWDLIKLCFMLYVSSSMIVIFVYDLKHYLIPDKVLFPAIIITFIYRLLDFGIWRFSSYILAAFVASGFFFLIWMLSKGRWMGFGDVKLAILMGLLLGVPNIFAALFLAFFFGAIISLILISFGKTAGWQIKSEVPFGPFLVIGTFAALFWGYNLISWYLELLV